MEHFLGWRMNIQSEHDNRLSVALFRAALKLIVVLCFGFAALGYVFDYEKSLSFYALFLAVVVAMVRGVVEVVMQYRTDVRASRAIYDRDVSFFDSEFRRNDTVI